MHFKANPIVLSETAAKISTIITGSNSLSIEYTNLKMQCQPFAYQCQMKIKILTIVLNLFQYAWALES